MMLHFEALPLPLTSAPDGVIRISGSRVPLETVIRAYHEGASPEELVQEYPLTLASVYAVLAYYLWHQTAVDAYVAERTAIRDAARSAHDAPTERGAIRARLLARMAARESAA